jgi:DNA-binding transcriptional ArsR family regulator
MSNAAIAIVPYETFGIPAWGKHMSVLKSSQQIQFPEVQVDVGAGYELLVTLFVVCDTKKHPIEQDSGLGIESRRDVRARISPDLLASIEQFGQATWEHLIGVVYECEAPRDVPALLAHLEAMDTVELRLRLFGYYTHEVRRATSPSIIFRAAQGDADAQKQLLQTVRPGGFFWHRSLPYLLSLDGEETKKRLLDLLRRAYDEIFREREQQIMSILLRDAEAKCALQHTVPPDQLIELATSGFEYVPEPSMRTVLLFPSLIMRPYVCDMEYHNIRIFCYPVADESIVGDENAPPLRLLRLYKALADERRLRILKRLATESASQQEIADEFGVARSTMHHHFVILRAAGLLRLRTSDRRYSVREDTIAHVADWLDGYLKRGSP